MDESVEEKDKVSKEELNRFWSQFVKNRGNLRFGQAFMNKYFPNLGGHTDIYYEISDGVAISLIVGRFVK